jgi:CDGSH-type Zn-finger protein
MTTANFIKFFINALYLLIERVFSNLEYQWEKDFPEDYVMEHTAKTHAHLHSLSVHDELVNNPASGLTSNNASVLEQSPEPTDQKPLDRWFLEQRGNKRVPKRLDIANEVLVTSGGPLKMTGNITLINEEGHVTHANSLNLCRCGASKNRPFCDDKHLDIEFFDSGAVEQLSGWEPVHRPQTITVTCVKNGPLKFRGYLRIYNKKGQQCITMDGALCRCGKSSKKPFCDNKQDCKNC